MKTVEHTRTPLARLFNLSLKEGMVPFEWKEANSYYYFFKWVREISTLRELQTSEFNISDL